MQCSEQIAFRRTFRAEEIQAYSDLSTVEGSETSGLRRGTGHDLLVAVLMEALLSNIAPGSGGFRVRHTVRLLRPLSPGSTVTVTAFGGGDDGQMVVRATCRNGSGEEIVAGESEAHLRP